VDQETERQLARGGVAAATPSVAVDSSTVVLLRGSDDAAVPMEVLLLERHKKSKAYAGAFVFPGGKVDDTDRWMDPLCVAEVDLAHWLQVLGAEDEQAARGFLVASVRETFEEAGVLLAHHRDGTPVSQQDLESPSFVTARARLVSREDNFDWTGWLVQEGLVLAIDQLGLWSWWVTPVHRPYRFDTRFFVAVLPHGQQATVDDYETTSMRWLNPATALAEYEAGNVSMRNPTLRNLEALLPYPSAQAVMDAVHGGQVTVKRMQPTVTYVDGELVVVNDLDAPIQNEIPTP
jgi:8-oxo-dGTP pyrophosphatase MutT (NUDIX family)